MGSPTPTVGERNPDMRGSGLGKDTARDSLLVQAGIGGGGSHGPILGLPIWDARTSQDRESPRHR